MEKRRNSLISWEDLKSKGVSTLGEVDDFFEKELITSATFSEDYSGELSESQQENIRKELASLPINPRMDKARQGQSLKATKGNKLIIFPPDDFVCIHEIMIRLKKNIKGSATFDLVNSEDDSVATFQVLCQQQMIFPLNHPTGRYYWSIFIESEDDEQYFKIGRILIQNAEDFNAPTPLHEN